MGGASDQVGKAEQRHRPGENHKAASTNVCIALNIQRPRHINFEYSILPPGYPHHLAIMSGLEKALFNLKVRLSAYRKLADTLSRTSLYARLSQLWTEADCYGNSSQQSN
jgi:hypothetical protein